MFAYKVFIFLPLHLSCLGWLHNLPGVAAAQLACAKLCHYINQIYVVSENCLQTSFISQHIILTCGCLYPQVYPGTHF